MNAFRLARRSILYYWRTAVPIALGVAISSMVITGSLLVGDSMHGSLKENGLARLGHIGFALTSPNLFDVDLATRLANFEPLKKDIRSVTPALLVRGAVRAEKTDAVQPGVQILGMDASVWSLYSDAPMPDPTGTRAMVNAPLARDLGLKSGDTILVTVGKQSGIPSDILFAQRKRSETVRELRLENIIVLPDKAISKFALDASTDVRRTVFLPRELLAEQIGQVGKANTLLIRANNDNDANLSSQLEDALRYTCNLSDYGLKLSVNRAGGCLDVKSDSLLLGPQIVRAVSMACAGHQAVSNPVCVYLGTSLHPLSSLRKQISYFVVAGISSNGKMTNRPDAISLNEWAAKDLGCKPGDKLQLEYMTPQADGEYRTDKAEFTFEGVLPMKGVGADPSLAPDFQGITDANSIGDWKTPFPVDTTLITRRDEEYWDRWRAAPKAFVPIKAVQTMWSGASFAGGNDSVTSMRVRPLYNTDLSKFQEEYSHALKATLSPDSVGLVFRPVHWQAVQASEGTTDFGQLFLGLSLFLVISSVGLAATLLTLMAERRASQMGVMLACGVPAFKASMMLFMEGLLLSFVGAICGVPAGILYAGWIIRELATRWSGAINSASLMLYMEPASLFAGFLAAFITAGLALYWSTRRLGEREVLPLLSGWRGIAVVINPRKALRSKIAMMVEIALAGILLILGATGRISAPSSFFALGVLLLLAGFSAFGLVLTAAMFGHPASPTFGWLVKRGAAAHAGHSLQTIRLFASAAFLLTAIAANTRDFSRSDYTRRDSGSGGFALVATSSLPIPYDFGSPEGRARLGFTTDDEKAFAGVRVFSFLLNAGDDVSCLNLAKPASLRILGVRAPMMERGGFSIASSYPSNDSNPWRLLNGKTANGVVPAFGDSESVMWTLHSGLDGTYRIPDSAGRPTILQFKGLVKQSVFAGEILVSERNFRQLYPAVTAPRYFLISAPPERVDAVTSALRRNLGDLGLEVRPTREILNALIAVQNTYLATFLALGGLGLLLGTMGLATVLSRNALERRQEFALMLACGFGRNDIARLLAMETAGLLIAGLVMGAAAALVAVIPQMLSVETRVNWLSLVEILGGVVLVGLVSCTAAGFASARGNLIEALRSE